MPASCTLSDLESAKLVVALKEAEHRPLLTQRFGGWEDRVTYWHVDDVDFASPVVALREIDRHVDDLIERLRQAPAAKPW